MELLHKILVKVVAWEDPVWLGSCILRCCTYTLNQYLIHFIVSIIPRMYVSKDQETEAGAVIV